MIDGIDGLAASMALLALTHANLSFNLILGSTPPDYAAFAVIFRRTGWLSPVQFASFQWQENIFG